MAIMDTTVQYSRQRAFASGLVLTVLLFAVISTLPKAHAVTSCNCVVFRLDDVQDYWIHDVQLAIMDSFIDSNTPLTPALEMNFYGSDSAVVSKVAEGRDAGLFELALHGWNHVPYNELSLAEQTSTLQVANDKLQTLHGATSNIFIPPYNVLNPDTFVAMDDADLEILSADLFPDGSISYLPLTYPPTDFSGIVSLPYTVNFIDDGRAKGSNGKSVSALKAEIDSSIADHGWAVLMLHPDDFAIFNADVEQNVVNGTQVATLQGLVGQLDTDGRTITSYNNLVDLIGDTSIPVDTVRPTGSILAPAPGGSVSVGVPFVVSGTAFDNVALSKVEVRATLSDESNGTTYGLASTGDGFANWQFSLTIPNASFTKVVVRLTDTAGNQQWLSLTVQPNGPVPDIARPSVTISSPLSGQQITQGSIVTVTGTASDNSTLSKVEVRAAREDETGGTAYSQAALNDGFWNFDLLMSNSEYTKIVARATDTSGNQQWAKISITFAASQDTTKPSVTITSPTSGQQVTSGSTLTVTGTASDNMALTKVEVRATLPDESSGTIYLQAALNGGSWSFDLPMTNAAFTKIVARATDTSGNQQWAKVSVVMSVGSDTLKPAVAITLPTAGSTVSAGQILVTGTASDNVGIAYVEVRTDGTTYAQATPVAPGDWSSWSTTRIVATGERDIVAHVVDSAGNQQWFHVIINAN